MTILVTRPSPSAEALVSRLQALGKQAWAMPLIEFTPGRELDALPNALQQLQAGDMVFVLSQQVMPYANRVLQHSGKHWPRTVDYYAIGRATAMALHEACGQNVVWPHERETSEILIQLHTLQNVTGKRALILRGNGGRALLGETLQSRGATVDFCECYQRCAKHYNGFEEARRWRNRKIDTLVVTSGEMLHQLYAMIPDYDRQEWLLRCRLVVVSDRLATQARELGWQDIVVAESADNDALLRTLQ
ncbi:uroporphyrinogen-III synthase [Enterobacterales bacterium CwR94]|nr:uroporphyrinogen-III synthase [Enterobacterales bacterium CwR94]